MTALTIAGGKQSTPDRWRRMTVIAMVVCGLLTLFGAVCHAEDGCPPAEFPETPDNKCVPVSEYNKLPLSDNEPMRFEAVQMSMVMVWGQGTGLITKDTPAEFRKFLESEDGKLIDEVVLHSPGGDLMAGLTLGQK